MMKTCTICKNEFPKTLEFFYKIGKDLRATCKSCFSLLNKKYYKVNSGKVKAQVKVYRLANLEKERANSKAWRHANKEKKAEGDKAYREAHKENLKVTAKIWKQENQDKVRGYSRKRRAQLRGNEHIPYTEQEVLDLYGTNCHICLEPIDFNAPRHAGKPGWQKGLHLDHVKPSHLSGANNIKNVKPAHGLCNLIKGTKEIYEN